MERKVEERRKSGRMERKRVSERDREIHTQSGFFFYVKSYLFRHKAFCALPLQPSKLSMYNVSLTSLRFN